MSASGCVEMIGSCVHLRKNSQRDDLFDHAQGLEIRLHMVVRDFVRGKAFLVKVSKTGFIAEERTVLNVSDAPQQFLDGALQPHQDRSGMAQQRKILRLGGGSAAQ